MKQINSKRNRGFALIMALGAVALVATMAAVSVSRQARILQIEELERERTQARLIVLGALDWARLVLRQDSNAGTIDHLGEPWAIPIKDASISDFIAIDKSNPIDLKATLSGRLTDEQSKLNFMNLALLGARSKPDREVFDRLFSRLGLPSRELESVAAALAAASAPQPESSAPIDAPLVPSKFDQLVLLGLSPKTLAALAPYATMLPTRTMVNVNTASPLVLSTIIPGLDDYSAENIARARVGKPFHDYAELTAALGGMAIPPATMLQAAFASSFYKFESSMASEKSTLTMKALLVRRGHAVRTSWVELSPSPIQEKPWAN